MSALRTHQVDPKRTFRLDPGTEGLLQMRTFRPPGRQGARDRRRLGLPIGAAHLPHEPRSFGRDHSPFPRGRTRGVYDRLIANGYHRYGNIATRAGDGYYGWPEASTTFPRHSCSSCARAESGSF